MTPSSSSAPQLKRGPLGRAKKSVMRKIIVYIATSADGYIARADGNVDWLDRPGTAGDYGMGAFYRSIDTILWGRKTYEVTLEFQKAGIKGAAFDPKVKNYIFSHHPPSSAAPPVQFVTEAIPAFARRLRATSGKDIWMMGGAALIASFIDENEVDDFIIHVIPTLIGEGIPLIAARHLEVPLQLRSCRHYSDGVVRLHYSVLKPRPRKGRGGNARPNNRLKLTGAYKLGKNCVASPASAVSSSTTL